MSLVSVFYIKQLQLTEFPEQYRRKNAVSVSNLCNERLRSWQHCEGVLTSFWNV